MGQRKTPIFHRKTEELRLFSFCTREDFSDVSPESKTRGFGLKEEALVFGRGSNGYRVPKKGTPVW